jgi:virulence factor Mce-like protein
LNSRRSSALIGAAALAAIVAVIYFLALYLGGAFLPGYEVTAHFARAGQLLRSGSDVKLRGVLVGSVSTIEVERRTGKARIGLRLFEEHEVPENVEAAVRAKTLFGEKYIELRIPEKPSARELEPGDEIPESRTIPPFEVETILEKGVPILSAVDPEAFGAALHALAEAFSGNEEALRNATVQSVELLTETERTLPDLERNLVHLKNFASALNQTDTDLVQALSGLTAVGEVIRENPDALRATVSGLVPLARDLGDILTAREADLADLAGKGRPVLEAVEARKDKLPALVSLLDGFLGVWIADLSEGPNWRITVTDPPIALGEPYAPGEEPSPRTAALQRLAADPDAPAADLLDIVLAPVPTEDLNEKSDELGLPLEVTTP